MTAQQPGAGAAKSSRADLLAAAEGFIAESYPREISAQGVVLPVSQVDAVPVYLFAGDLVTNIIDAVFAAGSAMTHTQLGIYNSLFNLVANTADNTAFAAVGLNICPLTATYSVTTSGVYYLAATFTGTTNPSLAFGPATTGAIAPITTQLGANARSAWKQAGQTTLPASATPVVETLPIWLACS